jgi:hypothetical protein
MKDGRFDSPLDRYEKSAPTYAAGSVDGDYESHQDKASRFIFRKQSLIREERASAVVVVHLWKMGRKRPRNLRWGVCATGCSSDVERAFPRRGSSPPARNKNF